MVRCESKTPLATVPLNHHEMVDELLQKICEVFDYDSDEIELIQLSQFAMMFDWVQTHKEPLSIFHKTELFVKRLYLIGRIVVMVLDKTLFFHH